MKFVSCNAIQTTLLEDNFNYLNLNVLKKYRDTFPKNILGLSDHTPGHTSVLGAVSLGLNNKAILLMITYGMDPIIFSL